MNTVGRSGVFEYNSVVTNLRRLIGESRGILQVSQRDPTSRESPEVPPLADSIAHHRLVQYPKQKKSENVPIVQS